MILTHTEFESENSQLALQQEDPLKVINNKASDAIYEIMKAAGLYLLAKETKNTDESDFLSFKGTVNAVLGRLEYDYRSNISAGLRMSKDMMRSIFNNPIIDSFKEILNKDLSKYEEDLLNKEYELYSKYYIKKNTYNYLLQMNPEVIYKQLSEVNDTNELNTYIVNTLDESQSYTSCSLREATLLYSRLLTYKDQMDTTYIVFDKLVELVKKDLLNIINKEIFTPQEILNFLSKRLMPVIDLITRLSFNIRKTMFGYIGIIEDITIKLEADINKFNAESKEEPTEKEYKAPIW